ncbi:rhomboid family intramembrane serine protease [Microvirga sp. W0021]|uniref:Rhomboid family intramembrane serine protease n=1 Tax=Hohaiivirga grylli TaxID=3133970 RepID=A0ABV0BMT9_9HYPH
MTQSPDMQKTHQPIINLPWIVTALIFSFIAIHLWRGWFLTPAEDGLFQFEYALVPARLSIAYLTDGLQAVVAAIQESGDADTYLQLSLVQQIMGEGSVRLETLLTHTFLHGSWLHLGFNAIWFAAFGAPLARRWGTVWFIIFCILTALTGALFHYLSQPYSVIPTIGASGVVSGMFGAAAWYVFDRNDSGYVSESVSYNRRLNLSELVHHRTALAFTGFWLVGNYFFAQFAGELVGEHSTIAWQAHVGGFIGGFLFFPLLDDHIRKAES